ncbi:MAG TPA: hypothetical protein VG077_07110 [Verrucomicrobiae bacterium]|nr:hypothetical protein [Verrucomicrobiae bacterium]
MNNETDPVADQPTVAEEGKEKRMNDTIDNPPREVSKPKHKFKPRHFYLFGSVIAIGIFVTYLADYASRETTMVGLSALGTLTMVIALAAFFKAYSKD